MDTAPEVRHDQEAEAPSGAPSDRPRLVYGDDGSPSADVVWLWINNHRWPGWRISVLTARIPDAGPPVGAERAAPHPWDPPYPRELLSEGDAIVEHLIAETDPRLALDSCKDAALVAVGPRGKGVLKHLHIGSTTEWLVGYRRPLAPVVVVRSARRTHEVLLCVDGSPQARSAVSTVAALPWIVDCHVTVLGVDDYVVSTSGAVGEAAALLEERGVRGVRQRVVAPPPPTTEFDVRSAILAAISEESPDLVAVGARGTGGLAGLLIGSVGAAVVHHAPCSVLVARSEPHTVPEPSSLEEGGQARNR